MASQVRFSLVKFVSELKAKHNGKPSGKVAENLNVFKQTEFYLPQFDDSKTKVRDVSRFRDDIRGLLAKEFRERPKQIEISETSKTTDRELSSTSAPGALEEKTAKATIAPAAPVAPVAHAATAAPAAGGSRKSRKTRSSKPNKH